MKNMIYVILQDKNEVNKFRFWYLNVMKIDIKNMVHSVYTNETYRFPCVIRLDKDFFIQNVNINYDYIDTSIPEYSYEGIMKYYEDDLASKMRWKKIGGANDGYKVDVGYKTLDVFGV